MVCLIKGQVGSMVCVIGGHVCLIKGHVGEYSVFN